MVMLQFPISRPMPLPATNFHSSGAGPVAGDPIPMTPLENICFDAVFILAIIAGLLAIIFIILDWIHISKNSDD